LNYGEGYREFSLKCEISESEGKRIYTAYHSAYPEVKGGFQALIRDMLLKGGVVNLLGRRRVFMGRYDDDTFKKAYAQLPQSSVGDIINERGLIEMYYNKTLYRPVEISARSTMT
jgi:DNA polymerase I-like protein with 3'-5' exonuclease and polymerase domains